MSGSVSLEFWKEKKDIRCMSSAVAPDFEKFKPFLPKVEDKPFFSEKEFAVYEQIFE